MREEELLITGNQMRFFPFFSDLESYNSGLGIAQWGERIEVITSCDCDGCQSFRWYPTLTALCAELYKQIMVKGLLKYLLYCRVLTFQCLAMSLNSGWCQVKKVGDLHQLCIGKFTGWCGPQNNPALMQGQQDTSWMERPGNRPDWVPVLIKSALCWNMNCCSLVFFTAVRSHIQILVGTRIQRTEFVIS
jgi:hypothetical protein